MKIIELIHDKDHPKATNVDFWLKENKNNSSQKFKAFNPEDYPELKGIDLIIIHGGSQHLWNKNDDAWLINEIEYVKEALKNNIPVIGFCLGAQIIAEALGGKVYKAKEKEVGWLNIKITMEGKKHKILEGLKQGFKTFLWHSDHYSLPQNCMVLGYTEAAPNQIFISNTYKAIGFQFHPEYTKENVKIYADEYEDDVWSGGRFASGKSNILKETEKIEGNYELFKKIFTNSIDWFLK
ncbi:type 1 glutamine amidotransferase [Clostridium sp. WILCCON 0269]|uniref:Type 1 glutamine amidotransferase n=1 Tax=Candidatus Clostridium eludens TaxID=3381663 RepID=A0ABW8SGN2_9CLOT